MRKLQVTKLKRVQDLWEILLYLLIGNMNFKLCMFFFKRKICSFLLVHVLFFEKNCAFEQ